MEERKPKVIYIGFFSDPERESGRKTAPAADTKMDYIASAIIRAGFTVDILSASGVDQRKGIFNLKPSYTIKKNGINVRFFDAIDSKFVIFRVLGRFLLRKKLCDEIDKRMLEEKCVLLVYHSLGLKGVISHLRRKRMNYVLELEEYYSDVIFSNKKRALKTEEKIINNASAYIYSTEELRIRTKSNKRFIICNGTYSIEEKKDSQRYNRNNTIHVVYAGTFDPRKGCGVAVEAAKFLPSNYHVHIIGFGNEEDTRWIIRKIAQEADSCTATITYDGLKTGREYIDFLQSCDIGLCPQDPSASFSGTSFPSKILSYLSNGLRVVSIRIPAIEHSAIGNSIVYYEDQSPNNVANAILSINLNSFFDGRELIRSLDNQFVKEVGLLLSGDNREMFR